MSKFVYKIADKNACFLINCKILVTRATEKQTLITGWLQTRHNRLVWKKIFSVKTEQENLLIYSLTINWNKAETKMKVS